MTDPRDTVLTLADPGAALRAAGVVYADYQSAKPVDPRVVAAMLPYLTEKFGNAASLHGVGDVATEALEEARGRVAAFFGADPREIVFTGGATEATNLAIVGYALRNKRKGNHVIISEAEHISVLNIAKYLEKQGFRVTRAPIDLHGRVSPKKLRARITDETILVSLQWASSEIGTVQPIAEVAELLDGTGIALHSDAVAAEGLVPIDTRTVPVSLLSLSSNDLYGPRGLGALYVRQGVQVAPVLLGGGQERGLRSGSEDLASIAGFAAAADIMAAEMPAEVERVRAVRDTLVERVLSRDPRIAPQRPPRAAPAEQRALPLPRRGGRGDGAVAARRRHRRIHRLRLQLQDARAVAHAHLVRPAARGGARLARVHLRPLEHPGGRGPDHGGAPRRDPAPPRSLATLQDARSRDAVTAATSAHPKGTDR